MTIKSLPPAAKDDDPFSRAAMARKLVVNALEIAAWTAALELIDDWDSPPGIAIYLHIKALLDNYSGIMMIMSLPEDNAAGIFAKTNAAEDRQIRQSASTTWRAVETHLPPQKVWEIKRCVNSLRHWCGEKP